MIPRLVKRWFSRSKALALRPAPVARRIHAEPEPALPPPRPKLPSFEAAIHQYLQRSELVGLMVSAETFEAIKTQADAAPQLLGPHWVGVPLSVNQVLQPHKIVVKFRDFLVYVDMRTGTCIEIATISSWRDHSWMKERA